MTPPFIANPDAHRCLPAALLMALRGLRADRGVSLDDLDRLTARRPHEGTWTHAAYLALAAFPGAQARAIDPFDYARFAAEPLLTVLDAFPMPVAETLANGFDLVAAAALARRLLDEQPLPIARRCPTLSDVDALLDDGWWLIANVNAAAIDGSPGRIGHSVLVHGRGGGDLIAHDPGSGGVGVASRAIDRATFERAWSFMGPGNRELLALRAAARAP
jgi:hypothetical protein